MKKKVWIFILIMIIITTSIIILTPKPFTAGYHGMGDPEGMNNFAGFVALKIKKRKMDNEDVPIIFEYGHDYADYNYQEEILINSNYYIKIFITKDYLQENADILIYNQKIDNFISDQYQIKTYNFLYWRLSTKFSKSFTLNINFNNYQLDEGYLKFQIIMENVIDEQIITRTLVVFFKKQNNKIIFSRKPSII